MVDQRNGVAPPKPNRPRKRSPGGVLGLMSKRRWFIVVVFLSSVTWSYTAGPPLSQSYISNRFFTNPNRFDYDTEKIYGNENLVFDIFEESFFRHTWIWQAGAYFEWIEGPTWFKNKLFFSDTLKNRIYSYTSHQGVQIELENSGDATQKQKKELMEPGSNGLAAHPKNENILFIAQHAARRVISRNVNTGETQVIASEFEGKKLNSPNDIAVDSSGEYLYFTDPMYGLQLAKGGSSPGSVNQLSKEQYSQITNTRSDLKYSGIYRVKLTKPNQYSIELIDKSLDRPNGIVLSKIKGQNRLYVTNSINGEFEMNIYELKGSNKPKCIEKWDSNSIQSHLNKNDERMIGINKELGGWTDGITKHPTMPYLLSTCPEGKICIINEENGRLEAAVKLADGVILSNVFFGQDNHLYLTANGNLWSIELSKKNLLY